MRGFLERIFGGNKPSLTTEERKRSDIRRHGGHIPRGDEVSQRGAPQPAEEVSVANHLGKAAERVACSCLATWVHERADVIPRGLRT